MPLGSPDKLRLQSFIVLWQSTAEPTVVAAPPAQSPRHFRAECEGPGSGSPEPRGWPTLEFLHSLALSVMSPRYLPEIAMPLIMRGLNDKNEEAVPARSSYLFSRRCIWVVCR